MLDKSIETDSVKPVLVELEKENVVRAVELLENVLSKEYAEMNNVVEYNSIKSRKLPKAIDEKWSHIGEGSEEISGNLLRLVGLKGSESIYEYGLNSFEGGIVVDFIMQRIGGGEENCHLILDTDIGSELVRINRNSVHLSSNSSRTDIDFNKFHLFRLVLENGISSLIINDRLSLFSSPAPHKKLNKIIFGCTKGLSTADFESVWPFVKVSTGKNILQQIVKENLDDAFYYVAKKFFDSGNNSNSLRELSKTLLINSKHQGALLLLRSLMEKVTVRDPLVYLFDDLINKIFNSELTQFWIKKKSQFHMQKIIEVNNVSVKFLTSMNTNTIAGLWDSFFSKKRESKKFFWALQNISLEVHQGEIFGIIGRNGSGKSTLLRVIANILNPDKGYSKIDGKAILLSSGMGFRDELSGLDNIYLGCLFMGMSKKDIEQQIDDIVDFAELQNDIHRTFKYYSDGMKSRLSFSVATHIKHDILLLDELLSAGDLSFNKKAATRMEELVENSRTAVIVTHATQFVRDHCTRALYLEKGHIKYFGDPDVAVDMYILDSKGSSDQ